MRTTLLILVLAVTFAACNNMPQNNAGNAGAMSAATAKAVNMAAGEEMDPVCEMPYDPEWTEYALHKEDTVHFCSENCKKAFVAKPEKYVKSL